MLDDKTYIVRPPHLVNTMNRNTKVLALNSFIAQLGKRITKRRVGSCSTILTGKMVQDTWGKGNLFCYLEGKSG